MNVVILTGRMTRDPYVGSTGGNAKYAKFTLAVDRPYTDGGQKTADFIECIAWRKDAELLENHGKKGKPFTIQGEIRTNQFTPEGAAKPVTRTEVMVTRIEFAQRDSTGDGGNGGGGSRREPEPQDEPVAAPAGVGMADAWDGVGE